MTENTPNIRIIRVLAGLTNCYLVSGDRTVIVDTGDPGFSGAILKAMRQNGIQADDVSLIYLTHGHIDHFGSVFRLRQSIPAPIAIHQADCEYLKQGIHAPLHPTNHIAAFLGFWGKYFKVNKRFDIEADVVFDTEFDLQSYGLDATILPTPAHTLGSSSLVLPGGIALTGDLALHRYLFWGPPESPVYLHDPAGFLNSIEKLKNAGVKTLYPGHGGGINIEEVKMTAEGRRLLDLKTGR